MFGAKKTHRDQDWLQSVLLRYESLLLRYAIRKTGSRDQAEDLVQSAFLKLIEHPDVGDDKLPQWLYTVCLNELVDGKRYAAVREKHVDDVPVANPGPSALAQLVRTDDLDCLMQALASLTEIQREMVALRFVEELSYKDISRRTNKTESHVGVILHESLKQLRVKHKEHCCDFLENTPL